MEEEFRAVLGQSLHPRGPDLLLDLAAGLGLPAEWGERAQESDGSPDDRLLHAARLLRSPERYAARFGQPACDLMLADCLWQVHTMIGKLTRAIYVLSRQQA